MGITKYNVIVTFVVADRETDSEVQFDITRPIATVHMKGTELFYELMDTAAQEVVEDLEDSLTDTEEVIDYKVKVVRA